MKKNRAFLKWAGGKYPLLDDIKRHLPKGECLVEPFVGAGSVFLNTDFSRYILADINSDLISLYNIVKMRTDEYVQAARELFIPETNCAEVYYQFREEFNKSQDPFRRAVLFLYLNRYGYNGLCRYNLRGEFNVPFGRYKKPISRKQSCITSLKKRRMPFSTVSLTPIAWRAQMMHPSSIAIRLMRRCLRPPTLRRITQTVLRLNNKRIWRRSPKVWLIAIFQC